MYSSNNQLSVVKLNVKALFTFKNMLYRKRPLSKVMEKGANYCLSLNISSSDKCGLPPSIGDSPKIAFW